VIKLHAIAKLKLKFTRLIYKFQILYTVIIKWSYTILFYYNCYYKFYETYKR